MEMGFLCLLIDWLNYLADHGAAVARAVPSIHGNLLEILQENNHGLTKTYNVKNEAWQLINWNEEEFLNVDKYIPSKEKLVIQKSNELMTRLKNIPKNQGDYDAKIY
jgi:hypothetical protein